MDKVIGLQEAISKVKQGDTLMIGGFGGFGFPSNLVWEVARQNIGELTVIAEDFGNGYSPFEMNSTPLLEKHLVKKAIISYCGGQPRITEQVFKGELEMEMVPQGTLAERIRAGGAGIGGFYTPTGVGTVVAEGKITIERDTGDIRFDCSDGAEIFIETDTGDVRGTLLSENIFITKTDTGRIDLPSSVRGGRCEIHTDTGDIKIEIK